MYGFFRHLFVFDIYCNPIMVREYMLCDFNLSRFTEIYLMVQHMIYFSGWEYHCPEYHPCSACSSLPPSQHLATADIFTVCIVWPYHYIFKTSLNRLLSTCDVPGITVAAENSQINAFKNGHIVEGKKQSMLQDW